MLQPHCEVSLFGHTTTRASETSETSVSSKPTQLYCMHLLEQPLDQHELVSIPVMGATRAVM